MKTHALIAIALLSSAATGCSSDSDSDPDTDATREDYDDAAQAIASATAADGTGGDLASMSDSVSIALGVIPFGFVLEASGEVHGNRLGVEYSYTVACEDRDGNSMPFCSDLTDSATVDLTWSGTLDTPNLDAVVERTGTWSISGLQSSTAIFEGDSTFSFDSTLRSIFRPGAVTHFMFDTEASYAAVAMSTETLDALSGSASLDLSARKVITGTPHDIVKSFSIHADLELHANRTASLTLDGDQRYTLDLATGAVIRVN